MVISCKDKDFNITIEAPPSKSIYHRELISSFLRGRMDLIEDDKNDCEDILATKCCLRSLALADEKTSVIHLYPRESGSTLRFMIPLAVSYLSSRNLLPQITIVIHTEGRLIERPIDDICDTLITHGISISKNIDERLINITGELSYGEFVISPTKSSQSLSGLLMSLPILRDSKIIIKGELVSSSYVDLTLASLRRWGFDIRKKEGIYVLDKELFIDNSSLMPSELELEGDWSAGAFLLCLSELSGGEISITNLNENSSQGDKAILDIISSMRTEREITVDIDETPDIAPYVAILGAFLCAKTVIKGISRLRIKESDRAEAIVRMLRLSGFDVEINDEEITIYGGRKDIGNIILSSDNDHRMVMAATLVAMGTREEITIDDIAPLKKSFPGFVDIILERMSV